jgi:hypothetical protein
LESTLSAGGFSVHVVRGPYAAHQLKYSALIRCLVNHANAWTLIAKEARDCLVVEADFVPVTGLGRMSGPLPNRPDDPRVGIAWLYSAGSTIYGVDADGYPFGHGNTTVAYQITPRASRAMLDFFSREMAVEDPGRYRPWETYLGIYMRRERGFRNYVPVYQYGEHGGVPNVEHRSARVRPWHQADVLHGPLAFMPLYARSSRLRYLWVRARAYMRGWARLVLLRYFDPRYTDTDSELGRRTMAWHAIGRLLYLL